MSFRFRVPLRVTYTLFLYRSNETKYDLVFLEALVYQSYHGLIHHVGSPPFIGILSYEALWTAAEAVGNPNNPAFIPDILLPYGNHMTFYERLQNTLFWLWMRYVKLVNIADPCLVSPYNCKNWTLVYSDTDDMDQGDMDCVDISQTVFNGYFGFSDFLLGKSRMFLKT